MIVVELFTTKNNHSMTFSSWKFFHKYPHEWLHQRPSSVQLKSLKSTPQRLHNPTLRKVQLPPCMLQLFPPDFPLTLHSLDRFSNPTWFQQGQCEPQVHAFVLPCTTWLWHWQRKSIPQVKNTRGTHSYRDKIGVSIYHSPLIKDNLRDLSIMYLLLARRYPTA